MDVFDLFAKLKLDTSDYESKLAGAKSALGAVGGAVGKIGAVSMAAVGAGATAVGALAKQAVSAYGSYEQLVGGVETLFGAGGQSLEEYAQSVGKDVGSIKAEYTDLMYSQQKVMDNAANAYKTAGLSANDYMETVTSFSASLLQSLNGDTVAAADVADRAIIDMSDNANKMGTSMESIQNAYQGFAKQNYTMLDNLKLGYGGTKSEMERLIEDASKMTDIQDELNVSVNAGDTSFANIVNAISVMQSSIGMAGTTSKEAASTIEGSLGSVSAAWTNLVTGLGDKDADLGELIGNVVDTASTAFENLAPVFEQALTGISSLIEQIAPIIAEKLPGMLETVLPGLITAATQIITSLSEALPTLLPPLLEQTLPALTEAAVTLISGFGEAILTSLPVIIPQVIELVGQLGQLIIDNLPMLISAATQIVVQLAGGISSNLPVLIPAMVDAVLTLADAILNNLDPLINATIDIMVALSEGLVNNMPLVLEKGPVIIEKLAFAIVRNLPKILKAGLEIIVNLVKGLIMNLPKMVTAAIQIITTLVQAFKDYQARILQIGTDIVKGIWEGIKDAADWLMEKLAGWVDDIVKFIKDKLGIKSPSKLMRDQVGKFMALGLVEGFNDVDPMGMISDEINGLRTGFEIPITTRMADIPERKDTSSLEASINALAEKVNSLTVNVSLEGDAQGIFSVVEKQSLVAKHRRGYALA